MKHLEIELVKAEGGYHAQCSTHPELAVSGKTKLIIRPRMRHLIQSYVMEFPSMKNEFFIGNKIMPLKFTEKLRENEN